MLYIFDMGGVVTSTCMIEEKLCKILGISMEEFKEKSKDLFELVSNGVIDAAEFWKIFSDRTKIPVTTDWWHWLFHPVLNEKTVKIVRELKKEGNRVVCGTNTISSHYFNHLERGDYSYFDQTYSSCAMGVSKPDQKFWEIILMAEGVQPKDVVFIDDRKENCDAARAMGIYSIQFTTAEELADLLGVKI